MKSAAPMLVGPAIGAVLGFNMTRRWAPQVRPRVGWTPTMNATSERSIIGIAVSSDRSRPSTPGSVLPNAPQNSSTENPILQNLTCRDRSATV
jgi:hypothetical protein